ncbi:hypothetical protein BHM03_00024443 [Ensete ventricosum]|nr:hypothetical protein BHM03_00024443 [Ensete ventricosum]
MSSYKEVTRGSFVPRGVDSLKDLPMVLRPPSNDMLADRDPPNSRPPAPTIPGHLDTSPSAPPTQQLWEEAGVVVCLLSRVTQLGPSEDGVPLSLEGISRSLLPPPSPGKISCKHLLPFPCLTKHLAPSHLHAAPPLHDDVGGPSLGHESIGRSTHQGQCCSTISGGVA